MPCIVTDMQAAQDWRKKEIGKRIQKIAEENGVKILIWAWLAGGPASNSHQVKVPDDVKGLKMRAAGKKFEYMLKEAGASITSMPSSEIYHAMATGVLNSALTSTASFVSYRLYEQVKFINIPRDYSIWFMGEPVCLSMKTWNKLSPEQQKVFSEVAEEMNENWAVPNMSKTTDAQIEAFSKAGVDIHYMTKDEFGQWLELAKKTAWKNFAETVEGGQELLDLALKAME
jgi:TRAP-type C4-dicarboxylate transport system substrate-binding protein